jgi:hypothetical protein
MVGDIAVILDSIYDHVGGPGTDVTRYGDDV